VDTSYGLRGRCELFLCIGAILPIAECRRWRLWTLVALAILVVVAVPIGARHSSASTGGIDHEAL
jgi:hypothetical protein